MYANSTSFYETETASTRSPPELPEGCTLVTNTSSSVIVRKSFWPSPALRAVTQFLNQSFTLPYLSREQVHDFCQGYWLQTNEDMKPLSERVLEALYRETKGHPGILQARLNQGTTGAEKSDRHKDNEASAPARPYRYKGKKQGWVPALLIIVGFVVLGGAGAYLYLTPQAADATSAACRAPACADSTCVLWRSLRSTSRPPRKSRSVRRS